MIKSQFSPEAMAFPAFIDWFALILSGSVILIGAWIKHTQLSEGGQAIAHMMGGRRIDLSRSNPQERRLLNIVEEMSIASGIPVPPVYVLHNEPNINAFAAGLNPANAVLGFSMGSIEKLNRDELQGVVAHEFSHIFNGDMRLNMRLITLVAGLQSIAHVGRFLLDTDSRPRSRSSNDRSGNLALFGFVIMLAGLFGSFMAGVVKAAVSRQREYLADATAMQYTRNPHGIGGALLKIMNDGFSLKNYFAKEASHFLFASDSSYLSLSTHPPLRDRVERVAPELLKSYENGSLNLVLKNGVETDTAPASFDLSPASSPTMGFATQASTSKTNSVSTLEFNTIESAYSASTAIAAILSVENLRIAQGKESKVQNSIGVRTAEALRSYSSEADFHIQFQRQLKLYMDLDISTALERRSRVLKIAMPHIRKLSKPDRQAFYNLADRLSRANDHVSIFEGACLAVLRKAFAVASQTSSMTFADSASQLLSAISNSAVDPVDALKAFQAGRTYLISQKIPGIQTSLIRYIRPSDQNGEVIIAALQTADLQSTKVKRGLLLSIESAALFDRKISSGEAELLRMVGLALDLPNPSLES